MVDLSVHMLGVKFKNPILLASAEPTFHGEAMKKGIDGGAAGIVAKSFTDSEFLRKYSNKPETVLLDQQYRCWQGKIPEMYTLVSRTCFPGQSFEEWMDVLRDTVKYAEKNGAVVIGNIASTDIPNWVGISQAMEKTGVKMLELNFGCPHYTEGKMLDKPVAQDNEFAARIIQAIKSEVSIPIIVKETPQLASMIESVRALKEAGADGVTLTNRFQGLLIDIEKGEPLIHGYGGVGGPWVKPLTLRAIAQVAKNMDIPISGSNGAASWKDVVEFMMAGSTTVQICTVVMVKGYGIIQEMLEGIRGFCEQKGYSRIEEVIKKALPKILPYSQTVTLRRERAVVNPALCNLCGKCVEGCFYKGMVMEGKFARSTESCNGCRFCTYLCPVEAIEMKPL